jgi:hypothetical protein
MAHVAIWMIFPLSPTGAIPRSVGNMENLIEFWLDNNRLEGHFLFNFGMVVPTYFLLSLSPWFFLFFRNNSNGTWPDFQIGTSPLRMQPADRSVK